MENKVVPYIVFESAQTRLERTIRKLFVIIIITIVLFFASNALWLYEWCQYDYSATTTTEHSVTVDGKNGTANYIGNDGSIVNGKDNSEDNNNENEDEVK